MLNFGITLVHQQYRACTKNTTIYSKKRNSKIAKYWRLITQVAVAVFGTKNAAYLWALMFHLIKFAKLRVVSRRDSFRD